MGYENGKLYTTETKAKELWDMNGGFLHTTTNE